MRPLIYSAILLLMGHFTAFASTTMVDVDKVIEKSFPISSDGTFDVTNKYGNVDIVTWDKNEVSIKVTISVKTGSQKKADEVFDRIDVRFTNKTDYVSAVTEIESKNNSWFNWGSWSSTDYQINYEVKMPASVHLKCVNKYGNTYIVDLNNGAELVMKYGNIRMGSVEGPTSLDLGYGNLNFGDIGKLKADVKYSNINGSSTQDITIESKYSNMIIGDIKSLRSDSKYDSYKIDRAERINNDGKYDSWDIGEVSEFAMESGYSGIKIDRLSGNLDLNQKFGSIKINKIDCVEAKIEIDVEYTDVKIDTDGCEDISIDYEGEYTDVNLSRDFEENVERDGKRTWLNTEFGKGKLRMRIDMRYGGLKIR